MSLQEIINFCINNIILFFWFLCGHWKIVLIVLGVYSLLVLLLAFKGIYVNKKVGNFFVDLLLFPYRIVWFILMLITWPWRAWHELVKNIKGSLWNNE